MGDRSQQTRAAGIKIANLTKLIASQASKNPDDNEAQQRARLALNFYSNVTEFPEINTDEISGKDQCPPDLPSPSNGGTEDRLLPNEIYQSIFTHVLDFEYAARQTTLLSLSVTSKRLRCLAEPHLYTYPRGAHSLELQWMFLFSLVLEPQRGLLVQSLEFVWYPVPDNTNLLIDILHACPNVQNLQIQRGSSATDLALITRDDVSHMAAIFAACPRVTQLWYSTFTEWLSEGDRYGDEEQEIFELCAKDSRFAKFAAQLQELALHGQVQWLLRALLPNTSPTLKSLTLGQSISYDLNSQLLSDLSLHSPHLEYLEVRYSMASPGDITQACRAWGNTLRNLRIFYLDGGDGWVGTLINPLHALEHLFLGPGCILTFQDLEAVAQSLPVQRFKSIFLEDLEIGDSPVGSFGSWVEEQIAANILFHSPNSTEANLVDQTIASLILSHSSTLTSLQVDPRGLKVGKAVLVSCKQANNLEELNVSLRDHVTKPDVDDLLEFCPKLCSVSEQFIERSSHPERWRERSDEKIRELDEEFERLPPSLG